MTVGPQHVSVFPPYTDGVASLLFQVRLPRILGALIIGAGLATSGAAYQAAFKNPIVSPSILGVTHGAGIGAALCTLMHQSEWIAIGALLGGCATVFIVWNIARIFSRDTAHLLVIGIIISGVASSALALIKFLADPSGILPAITYWLMGSLTTLRLGNVPILVVILVVCYAFYTCRWRLDVLTQPSEVVRSLGVDERKNIAVVVFGSTLIAALAASVSGVIGMVGLAIPHLVRMIVGTDEYRFTMLQIQLTGAIFLLGVDTIIRTLPIELPVGILTSLFGALIFGIALYSRVRRGLR